MTASDVTLGPLSVTATVKRRARSSAGAPDAGDRRKALTTLGTLTLAVPGRHNLLNALAVVALGEAWDLDPAAVRQGLESMAGVPGRMERVQSGQPFRVVTGHGAFILPFFRKVRFLTLAMCESEVAETCVTRQGIS